jgi:hypothetical protein
MDIRVSMDTREFWLAINSRATPRAMSAAATMGIGASAANLSGDCTPMII